MRVAAITLGALSILAISCSTNGSNTSGGGTGGTAGANTGGAAGVAGKPNVPGAPIGTGDESPSSVQLTVVYESPVPRSATDLAFHPTRDELWVLLRNPYQGDPCSSTDKTGCASLRGSVAIVRGATGPAPEAEWKQDPNAAHFMRRPTALAFGTEGTFATSAEARTGNLEDDPQSYIGPTWWSSDPAIFAKQLPGQNGSHLDMLHASPFSMGIAHQRDAIFWVFNGDVGSIDKYDFRQPHEPGGADHSDGEIYRYALGEVARLPEVPSHMVFDAAGDILYLADSGNGRVARLDTTATPVFGGEFPVYDPVAVHDYEDGVDVVDVMPPGTLVAPSGIAFHEGLLFVTDNATSWIYALDTSGVIVRKLDTGLPPGTLAGITIGPDGKAYFTDLLTSAVRRIDPT
ncbi:MAG: hypothetical protein IPI67_24055 [Myxococcales bacterium]|nr:hypothetical protein [Myxococcales bacterium]